MSAINNTAAQIAAAAIFELFPSIEFWGVYETSVGFCCDLFFPHAIHPELHFQIEEKMRQIVREKREIRDVEMVPFSAKELMKSIGHNTRFQKLEGKGLIHVVQIGSFYNVSEGNHLNNSAELAAFKLFPPEVLEGKGMRISGVAASSKEELKSFLKKWAAYPKIRHEQVGEGLGFWRLLEEGFLWLHQGISLRNQLLSFLKKILLHGALEVSIPKKSENSKILDQLLKEDPCHSIFEVLPVSQASPLGLFIPSEGTEIQWTVLSEKMISSLQSIVKTLTILGFGYCTRLIGPKRGSRTLQALAQALEQLRWPHEVVIEEGERFAQVQFLVADGLGRMWSVVTACAGRFLVCRVVVERCIALLLEQQGSLAMNFEERIRRLENK